MEMYRGLGDGSYKVRSQLSFVWDTGCDKTGVLIPCVQSPGSAGLKSLKGRLLIIRMIVKSDKIEILPVKDG